MSGKVKEWMRKNGFFGQDRNSPSSTLRGCQLPMIRGTGQAGMVRRTIGPREVHDRPLREPGKANLRVWDELQSLLSSVTRCLAIAKKRKAGLSTTTISGMGRQAKPHLKWQIA